MLPEPLHPAVVHMPIALALLLPVFAIVSLVAIRRGSAVVRGWAATVALAGVLAGSAWVAMETGEDQEERVEDVVGERALDAHADAAKLFTITSAIVLVVAGAGLLRGPVGSVARIATVAGSVAILAAGYNVGRLGGELVYKHGAASAYVGGAAGARETAESGERGANRAAPAALGAGATAPATRRADADD